MICRPSVALFRFPAVAGEYDADHFHNASWVTIKELQDWPGWDKYCTEDYYGGRTLPVRETNEGSTILDIASYALAESGETDRSKVRLVYFFNS